MCPFLSYLKWITCVFIDWRINKLLNNKKYYSLNGFISWLFTAFVTVQIVPFSQSNRIPFQEFNVMRGLSKIATIFQVETVSGTSKVSFPSCSCCQVLTTVAMLLHVAANFDAPWKGRKARTIPKSNNILKVFFLCDFTNKIVEYL